MKRLLMLLVSFAMLSLDGMNYRLAIKNDLPALLELVNSQAVNDSDKIVIVPKKFREFSLKSAIEKNRMFVAEDKGNIVGYKKLFLLDKDDEKNDVLKNEVRCIGSEAELTYAGQINQLGAFIKDSSLLPNACYTTCLYTGGDFTHKEYRSHGVNSKLMKMALQYITPQVIEHMNLNKAQVITMLYGVTQENAGKEPGMRPDRTVGISESFKDFIKTLEKCDDSIILQHYRYRAFMPTFDPSSELCQPLPDEKSIPGFGCVLSYALRKFHE